MIRTLCIAWVILCSIPTICEGASPEQCGLRLQVAVGAQVSADQVTMIQRSSALQDAEGLRRVMVMIAVESSFRPDAVSGRGATGLTQTLPIARAEVDRAWPGLAPQLPDEADVWYGSSYLRWCHERYSSWTLAYICYNSGPSTTDSYLQNGVLPSETLYYVVRNWRLYEQHCSP